MLPDCIPLSPKLRSWISGQFGGGLIRGWWGWRRLWLTRPTCCPSLSLPHPHPHRFICVAVCSVHPTLWQEELEELWYNSLGTIWLKNPSTILIQAPGLAADLVASLEILAIQVINLPSRAWRDIGNQPWNSSGSSLRILDCRWIRCWGNQSVRSRSKGWMWRWEVGEDLSIPEGWDWGWEKVRKRKTQGEEWKRCRAYGGHPEKPSLPRAKRAEMRLRKQKGTRIVFSAASLDSLPVSHRWHAAWPKPSPHIDPDLAFSSLCLCPCTDSLPRTAVFLRLGIWAWSLAIHYTASWVLTPYLAFRVSLFLDIHL